MKIWLDDLRVPPSNEWNWVKSVEDCIRLLGVCKTEEISLDNDLGLVKEGYEVICYIEEKVFVDRNYIPPKIHIHSANTVARNKMHKSLENIKKFLKMREKKIL